MNEELRNEILKRLIASQLTIFFSHFREGGKKRTEKKRVKLFKSISCSSREHPSIIQSIERFNLMVPSSVVDNFNNQEKKENVPGENVV